MQKVCSSPNKKFEPISVKVCSCLFSLRKSNKYPCSRSSSALMGASRDVFVSQIGSICLFSVVVPSESVRGGFLHAEEHTLDQNSWTRP